MRTRTVADVAFAGKTVLMRVDFNVPIKAGKVSNDRRIVQALPTIRHVLDQGARLVLMSHLGRPAEKGFEADFSMGPVAEHLAHLLGKEVRLGPPEVVGEKALQAVRALLPGDVLLLENLRFHPGETIEDKAKKNPDKRLTPEQQQVRDAFVEGLAALGDTYVNDAFGTCHRKHASMYFLPLAIKKRGGAAVAGFLVEKEIKYLHDAVHDPKRPFVAILGGAKVSDKTRLIESLLEKVDRLIIGGAMAYTLLRARGVEVGKSLVEEERVEEMKAVLAGAGDKVLLPIDHVATDDFEKGVPVKVPGQAIPGHLMGMDIGEATVALFCEEVSRARTIVWNGPMGVFERPEYAHGTRAVAEAVAKATDRGAVSVVGGGDSAAAVEQFGLSLRMTHVSTGGGASIEYLEGRPMPPLEVLDQV